MTRPTCATLRLSALRHNLEVARRRAPDAKVMAVVKANAYGHGLLRVARALAQADAFGVLEIEAAARLRQAGLKQPIVLLEGCFDALELAQAAQLRATAVVHSMEQMRMLEAVRLSGALDVFLKVNSGMNRLGVAAAEAGEAVKRLQHCANVGQITLMTHFACADDARGIAWQLERFAAAVAGLELPQSLANSAALLRYPGTARDWMRPGIMLYGVSPFPDVCADALDLRPVMTLSSEVIAVQRLDRGDSVGYGATFVADAPMRIGIVACGYADGYPRHAGTGAPVWVAGQRTRTLGRPSMDMIAVDLTLVAAAGVGAPVVLWGEGLPVEEVAAAADTVAYELLCAVTSRVRVVEID